MELKLEHEYLADENEREEAKAYFTDLLGESSIKAINFVVGPYKNSEIEDELTKYIEFKLDVSNCDIYEKGWIFKKRTASFTLKPLQINSENMSLLADTFYDVILGFNVRVDVAEA